MKKTDIINKTIYHINFVGNIGNEVNSTHLGIIFKIPGLDEMVFCIPLTSPKPKHFKSADDFETRNKRSLKHLSWFYIEQTDSIAKFDQFRTISIKRIKNYYKNTEKEIQTLDEKTVQDLIVKFLKYINKILN